MPKRSRRILKLMVGRPIQRFLGTLILRRTQMEMDDNGKLFNIISLPSAFFDQNFWPPATSSLNFAVTRSLSMAPLGGTTCEACNEFSTPTAKHKVYHAYQSDRDQSSITHHKKRCKFKHIIYSIYSFVHTPYPMIFQWLLVSFVSFGLLDRWRRRRRRWSWWRWWWGLRCRASLLFFFWNGLVDNFEKRVLNVLYMRSKWVTYELYIYMSYIWVIWIMNKLYAN